MRAILLVTATVCISVYSALATVAQAEDKKPAAPVAAPAAPVVERVVKLTDGEIQVIATALTVAAGQCGTVPDGCVIGMQRAALIAKFQAAMAAK